MLRRHSSSVSEAAMFKEQVISKWKPSKDVWPFLYGDEFLGSFTAVGGIFMTHAFRKELKIRPYARITCYLPAVGLTAIGCTIFQSYVITANILQGGSCPLCISTKAAVGQVVYGIGLPLLLATAVCFHVADRLLTYPIPPLLKAPGEVFRLFKKIVMKNSRPVMVIGAVHFLATYFITYQKNESLYKIGYVFKKKD